jgi:hypothetical protein
MVTTNETVDNRGPLSCHSDDVLKWLRLLCEPSGVVELRILGVQPKYGKPVNVSGFFDHEHLGVMAAEAVCPDRKAKGVYFTLNPLRPDILARRCNRVDVAKEQEAAADKHVARRRWLLIDADPVRDSLISATDNEKAMAQQRALAVREFLAVLGWPAPVVGDSGNGWHLLYRIDLPADDGGLVKGVLEALKARFDDPAVKIDGTVFNPSRICKLYGTKACKGDNVFDRPHRCSRLVEVPGWPDVGTPAGPGPAVVSQEVLAWLAGEAPAPEPARHSPRPAAATSTSNGQPRSRLDVGRWLSDRGVAFTTRQASGGLTAFNITCPFDSSHGGTDAAILQLDGGGLSAKCYHDSCSGRSWAEFKEAIGPPEAHHWGPPLTPRKEGRNQARANTDRNGHTSTHPRFAVGDRVVPSDRENVGTIVDIGDDGRYQVHFVSPEGDQATVEFLEQNLRPLGQSRSVAQARYHPLPPFVPFPLAALPPILSDVVQAAAESIGCDAALVALPALSVAAGCIGNARALLLKKGWVEPCVLWALTVAQSGGHKSPAYRATVNPLMEWQVDLYEAVQEQKEQYKRALEEWQGKSKDERGDKPEPPGEAPMFITSDTTIEAMGELLRKRPKGMLLARDELDAWFQSFTRYKGKGAGSDRPQWLEMNGANTLIIDRLTREGGRIAVRRAATSVTGTVQPSVLADALDKKALAAGLGARFLMAMPPRRKRVWSEAELSADVAERYGWLLKTLLDLPLFDERKRKPHVLGLSVPARLRWIDFFNEWGEVQFGAEGAQLSAYSKLEGYTPRFALLHHVVAHVASGVDDRCAVTESSIEAAIALARWFAGEAVRIYAVLGESEAERDTRSLVEWIAQRGGKVSVRDLQRSNGSKWRSRDEAAAALDQLVSAGLGHWEEGSPSDRGGHQQRWFTLLPTTPDTSDTRPGEASATDGASPDTRSDTRPDGTWEDSRPDAANPFVGRACGGAGGQGQERVSEVSGVKNETEQTNGPVGPGAEGGGATGECREDSPQQAPEVFEV